MGRVLLFVCFMIQLARAASDQERPPSPITLDDHEDKEQYLKEDNPDRKALNAVTQRLALLTELATTLTSADYVHQRLNLSKETSIHTVSRPKKQILSSLCEALHSQVKETRALLREVVDGMSADEVRKAPAQLTGDLLADCV